MASLTSAEKSTRVELSQLRIEHDDLQQRLNTVLSSRQADRQTISSLERRIADERRQRSHLESQLAHERKHRKQEEAAVRAAHSQRQSECTDACRLVHGLWIFRLIASIRQMKIIAKFDVVYDSSIEHLARFTLWPPSRHHQNILFYIWIFFIKKYVLILGGGRLYDCWMDSCKSL